MLWLRDREFPARLSHVKPQAQSPFEPEKQLPFGPPPIAVGSYFPLVQAWLEKRKTKRETKSKVEAARAFNLKYTSLLVLTVGIV